VLLPVLVSRIWMNSSRPASPGASANSAADAGARAVPHSCL